MTIHNDEPQSDAASERQAPIDTYRPWVVFSAALPDRGGLTFDRDGGKVKLEFLPTQFDAVVKLAQLGRVCLLRVKLQNDELGEIVFVATLPETGGITLGQDEGRLKLEFDARQTPIVTRLAQLRNATIMWVTVDEEPL